MATIKKPSAVKKFLQGRSRAIDVILSKDYPPNGAYIKEHERRIFNASIYRKELDESMLTLIFASNVTIVSLEDFSQKLNEADFSSIELDGTFCKLGLIQNFPLKAKWIIYLAPLNEI